MNVGGTTSMLKSAPIISYKKMKHNSYEYR